MIVHPSKKVLKQSSIKEEEKGKSEDEEKEEEEKEEQKEKEGAGSRRENPIQPLLLTQGFLLYEEQNP